MATKLRRICTNKFTKFIAFILVVILLTAAVVQMQYLSYRGNYNPEALFITEYKDSDHFFYSYVVNAMQWTVSLLNNDKAGQPAAKDDNYYYYITDGKKTYTNVENSAKSFFQQYDQAFYAYENGTWSVGANTNPLKPSYYNFTDRKYTLYLAFSPDFLAQKQEDWLTQRAEILPMVITIIGGLILALLGIIFLILVTGRRPEDEELHLTKLDKIYSEFLALSFIPLLIIWIQGVNELSTSNNISGRIDVNEIYSMLGVGALTAAVAAVGGLLLLSLVRKIKAGKLLKHSLVFVSCYQVYDFGKSLFDGRKFARYPLTKALFYRQLVFITASAVLVLFTFLFLMAPPLFLLPPIMEIAIIYWYIKGNNQTFEAINQGFNESIEEQMRAERLKIALVTNVSHDLKTPLTSIISYVDLLAKEENMSETARDYVQILTEKSNRLKQIVADLFDLAKSTSGDIALDLEKLDLKRLIEQTLGDMEAEIEKSELQVKIKLPDHPVTIVSDGKKLYRVFQNVIDNTLKYALKGTRVFVELEESNGKAIATIKNTAGYEMDFTAEEILQRFSRGDKARTTEGSGLGLSIAESFTHVCGGTFKVDIDGDLFKVTITF